MSERIYSLKSTILIIAIIFLLVISTSSLNIGDNETKENESNKASSSLQLNDQHCLFNCDYLVTGQSKDGIPSIDNPKYIDAPSLDSISSSETVLGVVVNEQAYAYPYNILDWHEIVNVDYEGVHFSITYCPLTATGILFKTEIIGNSELGVSGKLYENNLVFYDRDTDSFWSQMMHRGVKGEYLGDFLDPTITVETTWAVWFKMFPNTKLLSQDTGYNRDYDRYPYGSYKTDGSLYFPSSFDSTIFPFKLLQEKDIVHVVDIEREKALIPFILLENTYVLNFELNQVPLVTFFSPAHNTAITYQRPESEGKLANFTLNSNTVISDDLSYGMPTFFDGEGTIWNMKGEAIADNLPELELVVSFNAFWFAASVFYYNALIFTPNGEATRVHPEFTPEYTPGGEANWVFIPSLQVLILVLIWKRRRGIYVGS